jgi:hypothetical protein
MLVKPFPPQRIRSHDWARAWRIQIRPLAPRRWSESRTSPFAWVKPS